MLTAGRTALFSGFTVAAAMAALVILPQRFLYSIAVAGASVGVLSAVLAILVVPSLLSLLGTRIDALSIRRGPAVSDESGGWYRLARGVMRHPVGVALASSALLLAAAAPLLWTTLTGPSAEAVPQGKPSYETNSYVEAHYPRELIEAVTVTVDGGAGKAALARYRRTNRSGRRRSPRRSLRPRFRSDRLRQLRPRGPGPLGELAGHGQGDPRAQPPNRGDGTRSPATRPASSTRSRA